MRIHWLIPVVLALGPASSEEPASVKGAPPGPEATVVQVRIEYVEMSHESLTNLLSNHPPTTSDATELRKMAHDMILEKEATVMETQVITVRDGQTGRVQSHQEAIYPTEYDFPVVPCGFSGPMPDRPLDATPTAFDTRNCGSTLGIGPEVSKNGKVVKLLLESDLTWQTGKTPSSDYKDSHGSEMKREMPDFYSLHLKTLVSCPEGRYLMAAVLSPKDETGAPDMTRKIVIFVKCDVLRDS